MFGHFALGARVRRLFISQKRFLLLVAVATVVVALDAISKRIVQDSLAIGEKREIIPDILVLTHVQNTGAAYGLLTGQRWLLVVSATAIAALTPLLMRALPLTGRWAWSGPVLTGMIIGGAAGNLVERARIGYVTDFVQTPPIDLFQVFNVADASISVAITALLILTFLVREPAVVAPPVPASPEGAPAPAEPEALAGTATDGSAQAEANGAREAHDTEAPDTDDKPANGPEPPAATGSAMAAADAKPDASGNDTNDPASDTTPDHNGATTSTPQRARASER